MAVETPLMPLAPDQEIEAGVIEDARARQRRHRGIAAALIVAAALAAGLILGFTGGGGGSRAGRHSGGRGSGAGAAGHASDQVPAAASLRLPPNIGQFGLIAPRVGWAVNGVGFFITRDGGRRWSREKVPNLSGDILAELYTTASPAADTLVLSFTSGTSTYDRTCPGAPSPAIGAGALAVSTDSGRSWRASSLPACRLASSLSFLDPEVGFALAHESAARQAIYQTTDGARSWHFRGTIPLGNSNGSIAVASRADAWAVRFTSGLGASGRGTLYRTNDGGRSWTRSDICHGTTVRMITTTCQAPRFFGTAGVMPAVATNSATHTNRLLLYTTKNAGRTWSAHQVPIGQALKWYIIHGQPIPFSAPNARDLFVFLSGALYTSVDGGRTWSRLPEPHLSGYAVLDFASAEYGWIRAGSDFDYTTDGGRHWKQIGRH
ncbi:hypothetical protein [Actinospica sp.]|jgi:photosystem II stability/assembly factor-like uncharacterized protein|uniref:hypothetical protein n=1 Tax=Actinospica sp. TaxID=1872142 RepID=UPI002BF91AD8|nr:hypothetical protein [Actinospica sp.]HWG25536.1 hypothetical protein [Actinospica sp.]